VARRLQESIRHADGTIVTPASARTTPAVEAALCSVESLTRALAEDVPFSALLLTDRDGLVRHAAGARWTERGYDVDAMPGRPLRELLPLDLHELVSDHYAAVALGEVRRFALPYGPGYRALLLPVRATDGSVAGSLALAWDESEELRAERAARRELARRLAQQAAVARLGELALRRAPLEELTAAACRAVAEGLEVELVHMLERADEPGLMRVGAGLG
jgi:PAS fold